MCIGMFSVDKCIKFICYLLIRLFSTLVHFILPHIEILNILTKILWNIFPLNRYSNKYLHNCLYFSGVQ